MKHLQNSHLDLSVETIRCRKLHVDVSWRKQRTANSRRSLQSESSKNNSFRDFFTGKPTVIPASNSIGTHSTVLTVGNATSTRSLTLNPSWFLSDDELVTRPLMVCSKIGSIYTIQSVSDRIFHPLQFPYIWPTVCKRNPCGWTWE